MTEKQKQIIKLVESLKKYETIEFKVDEKGEMIWVKKTVDKGNI